MDEDDFGDLYDDQPVVGLSSGGAASLQNSFSDYTIFDDGIEEDKAYVTPPAHTLPSPPPPPAPHQHNLPTTSTPVLAKLHQADQLAERDSDEDDDMLLLGYNSKSGAAGNKIQVNDTQTMGVDDPEEEFAKLTKISNAEIVAENGLVPLSIKSNRIAVVCVPGITPTEELSSESHRNHVGRPTASPDVSSHTITIPGLSTTVSAPFFDMGDHGDATQDAWEQQQVGKRMEGADDWDTDSDDDLRIVLNTEYPYYASGEKAASGRYEAGSEDEDDEDLIIFAGGEPAEEGEDQLLQPPDAQVMQGDGPVEKQTGVEDGKGQQDKVPAGVPPPPPASRGYGYHNYNSPYKYVRAGASAVYNVSTGQTPGGRGGPLKLINGRGDWRGPGRGAFGPQFSSWSTPSCYEFTLPPSMTVFEIDLDSFDEKPWRQPAVDISDFFNFGFDETTWKDYCKQLAQLRLESTMQSKIRVYESGRTEQDYDPDLPPELAVAQGLQEGGDKIQQRLMETDITAIGGGRRGYTPMPIGRPIEVEGGLGDRRPSADSRKQRIRDSDCILLIDAVEIEDLEAERLQDENVDVMDGEVDKDEVDEEQQQDEDQEDEEEEPLIQEPKVTLKTQHLWQKERMPRAASKPAAEEIRDLDLARGQSANLHEDTESKPDGDTHESDSRPLHKEEIPSQKDTGVEIHAEDYHGGLSAGRRVDDLNAATSRERISWEVQADSSGCSSKRQRLVSPEGSHTASWDNCDAQKSARSAAYTRESRDSGESAMEGREDASRHRKKHKGYSELSRGDQYRDFRQEPEFYHKKPAPSRHEVESEVHLHVDILQETRKRPKQGLPDKVTSKDFPRHSKDRDDGRGKGREDESEKKGYLGRETVHHKDKTGSRSESRKRDEEDRDLAHYRDKGGSRSESRRKEEVERRDRHDSRRRDSEDRRDRPEKDSQYREPKESQHRESKEGQHRDKEVEPLDWHISDKRKKEDDHKRKDRLEDASVSFKKDRERNVLERHDRDSGQHMRRKEEDASKKEKLEDRHKAKSRDGNLKESEDSRRNIEYQESHGRAHKDEERAQHSSRSGRRHDEDRADRAWRGRDDSRMSDSTRSAEPRSHSKDRRKGHDDHGKEKSRLHDGRVRSAADHDVHKGLENYERDSGKHSRLSDDPRISERGLHSEKHKFDTKRSKDIDREKNELATQSAENADTNKRKRSATDKSEQGNRKRLDDSLTARTRDSQSTKAYPADIKELNDSKSSKPSAKAHLFDAGERGSSGEEDQQKGRSKLERWASHKDLESNISERLLSQSVVKKDEKFRPGSRDKQHRDSSGLRDDAEQENRHHAVSDRKSGKNSSSIEQANGKASKLKEKGETLAFSKEVDADKKDFTDLPEHHQEDTKTNMAAKLERRKERFKVSVEDKDKDRKLDQEGNQLLDKDDSRQERPPRKRRWASG